MKVLFLLIFCFSAAFPVFCQEEKDSLPYELFKHKIVLYTDLGFDAAPFSIKYNFPGTIDKIQFKHNIRPVLGLGCAYKWFALRLSFNLPGTLRPVSRYGMPSSYNLGFNFNVKKNFGDFDFKYYNGYVVKNAFRWDDSLNELHPNDIRPDTKTISLSANLWHFFSPELKMQAIQGKVGHYNRESKSIYLKYTFNIFGVGNENTTLIPVELIDSIVTKSKTHAMSAIDVGLVPGYVYVNKINNWQFAVFGGFGAVIQAKFFSTGTTNRGYLGLAPRADLKVTGGYTSQKYFVWLITDFDIKSIHFGQFKYNQTFYTLKLAVGMRLDKKYS